MNKIITYLLCFAVFAVNAYGTNYYVDSNGNDTNDGLSWETAVKTLGKAGELSTTGDNVYVKSGTYSFTGTFAFGNASYYGGFNGNEASPSERLLTDNDGNGITEPWEFQYPTLLSTTYNNGSAFTFLPTRYPRSKPESASILKCTPRGNLEIAVSSAIL